VNRVACFQTGAQVYVSLDSFIQREEIILSSNLKTDAPARRRAKNFSSEQAELRPAPAEAGSLSEMGKLARETKSLSRIGKQHDHDG
jgi:hypothetical protein